MNRHLATDGKTAFSNGFIKTAVQGAEDKLFNMSQKPTSRQTNI